MKVGIEVLGGRWLVPKVAWIEMVTWPLGTIFYILSYILLNRNALSSSSGLINVYNSTSYSTQESIKDPKPIKSIGNLTTAISVLKFNHDAQLLAIASQEKKDSMRLVL